LSLIETKVGFPPFTCKVAMCDKIRMDKLNTFIAAEPGQPMRAWAERFGISRPYLYSLLEGTRYPSLAVAQRIEKETGGAVPLTAWPNINAVAQAVGGRA
jgi:hypothetical protein